MIVDGKKWHYLVVKKLYGDFYCLNYFYSFATEDALKKHEMFCKDNGYCYVEMPDKDNKILKYNPEEKFMKVPFIINADLESLLEKMNTCYTDPEKSSTTKIKKHTPSGYSMYTLCSFGNTLSYYRGKDYMR